MSDQDFSQWWMAKDMEELARRAAGRIEWLEGRLYEADVEMDSLKSSLAERRRSWSVPPAEMNRLRRIEAECEGLRETLETERRRWCAAYEGHDDDLTLHMVYQRTRRALRGEGTQFKRSGRKGLDTP